MHSNETSLLKAAAPWFGKRPEPRVRAGDAREGLCPTWQCTLDRADWQMSVRVWQTLSRLFFARASRYIHVLSFSGRCWGWFTCIKNVNTVSPELFWSGRWDYDITSRHSAEVQSSWRVLELTHRGKVPQREEMCYLLDCFILLHLFMWVSLFPYDDH